MNVRQLRYPLFVGSVLLLLVAIYSDAQEWSTEPLIELMGTVIVLMTASVWWR